jgi:hypothetical protein
MGSFITEGLYNGEVNSYVYFGMEPDLSTFGEWGHFTQIVWKSSSSVGCYTADCSATGLVNAGPPIPPYFTVCNYEPAGKSAPVALHTPFRFLQYLLPLVWMCGRNSRTNGCCRKLCRIVCGKCWRLDRPPDGAC